MLSPGERCLVVEDVVTTGGSTMAAIEALREAGLEIAAWSACSIAWRAAEAIAAAAGAPYVALATIDDVYPERPDAQGPVPSRR